MYSFTYISQRFCNFEDIFPISHTCMCTINRRPQFSKRGEVTSLDLNVHETSLLMVETLRNTALDKKYCLQSLWHDPIQNVLQNNWTYSHPSEHISVLQLLLWQLVHFKLKKHLRALIGTLKPAIKVLLKMFTFT